MDRRRAGVGLQGRLEPEAGALDSASSFLGSGQCRRVVGHHNDLGIGQSVHSLVIATGGVGSNSAGSRSGDRVGNSGACFRRDALAEPSAAECTVRRD